jgi:hypothetical protein
VPENTAQSLLIGVLEADNNGLPFSVMAWLPPVTHLNVEFVPVSGVAVMVIPALAAPAAMANWSPPGEPHAPWT